MADSHPPGDLADRSGDAVDIDTTPIVPAPPAALIEAAARSIPVICANVHPNDGGVVELVASELVKRIRKARHTLAAAQWAVHEAVLAGRLQPGLIKMQGPSTGRRVGGAMRWVGGADDRRVDWTDGREWTVEVPKGKPAPFETFKVIATDQLWQWWRTLPGTIATPEPETVMSQPFDPKQYESVKTQLCRFMQTRFVERSLIGCATNFAPSELLDPELGFMECDKAYLVRAFEELRVDGLISFGLVEMATSAKAYDPWFNGHRRLIICPSVLKADLKPDSFRDDVGASTILNAEHVKGTVKQLEQSGSGQPVKKPEGRPSRFGREELAIALAVKNPKLTVTQIAADLGVNRQTPYRWPKFIAVWNGLQESNVGSPPPRGSKEDGMVVAFDDEE